MYSYRDNTKGMLEAMDNKRSKYQRAQRSTDKNTDDIIDLTGITMNANNNNNPYTENDGDISVTYFNSDGSTRTFRSQINTQTERSKQSGIRSKLAGDTDNANQPILMSVSEDKGGSNDLNMEDEYEKYDSEFNGQADQFLINSGATILHSEITLTDSSGRNRTVVRRNQG